MCFFSSIGFSLELAVFFDIFQFVLKRGYYSKDDKWVIKTTATNIFFNWLFFGVGSVSLTFCSLYSIEVNILEKVSG